MAGKGPDLRSTAVTTNGLSVGIFFMCLEMSIVREVRHPFSGGVLLHAGSVDDTFSSKFFM